MKLKDILNEVKINSPNKSWKLNSDDYKSFYQLTEYCDRWGVDWSEVDNYDFNNDYDFFVAVWNSTAAGHVQPNYCLFTEDDLEELAYNFGLDVIENPALPGEFLIDYNDPNMKKIIAQLNKHAGRK